MKYQFKNVYKYYSQSEFKIAADIDTKYADAFKKVKKMGVEPLCYDCSFGRNGISVNKKIKILN